MGHIQVDLLCSDILFQGGHPWKGNVSHCMADKSWVAIDCMVVFA